MRLRLRRTSWRSSVASGGGWIGRSTRSRSGPRHWSAAWPRSWPAPRRSSTTTRRPTRSTVLSMSSRTRSVSSVCGLCCVTRSPIGTAASAPRPGFGRTSGSSRRTARWLAGWWGPMHRSRCPRRRSARASTWRLGRASGSTSTSPKTRPTRSTHASGSERAWWGDSPRPGRSALARYSPIASIWTKRSGRSYERRGRGSPTIPPPT